MNDDPILGFTGMTLMGHSPQAAYDQIVANLIDDPGALELIERMLADPAGQDFMNQSRQQWSDLGFSPPWERAREILDEKDPD